MVGVKTGVVRRMGVPVTLYNEDALWGFTPAAGAPPDAMTTAITFIYPIAMRPVPPCGTGGAKGGPCRGKKVFYRAKISLSNCDLDFRTG